MNPSRACGAILLTTALVAVPVAAPAVETAAHVHFQDTQNRPVGEATLRDTPHGVLITLSLRDLPPGEHGFHIHETGKCLPPFESAGGHFNPGGKKHGFEDAKGPHAGDLANLVVPESGRVKLEMLADDVSLEGKHALLDGDGAALVIHSGPDDHRTDPAGDSGARIACGIVQRAAAAAGSEPRTAERPDRTPAQDVPASATAGTGRHSRIPPSAQNEPRLGFDEVRDVQRRLGDMGYDAGTPDGTVGEKTRAAIRQFQEDRGLDPTGHLNERTLAAIRLDLGAPTAGARGR
jgi:Cu-Zn family superoxide dismutase